MAKGRHASSSSGGFYRDLGIMVLGILIVGAVVFFVLYLFVGNDPDEPSTTTSPVAVETTTATPATTTSTAEDTTTSTTTRGTTTTTVPVRPPSEVTVAVLNSVGLPGAAGAMTAVLVEAGYQTLQAADYEPEQDPSRLWYREGFSAEANEMLQFIPGALVEPLPDDELRPGADVIMVLGTGYEG